MGNSSRPKSLIKTQTILGYTVPLKHYRATMHSLGVKTLPARNMRAALSDNEEVHNIAEEIHIKGSFGSKMHLAGTDFLTAIEVDSSTVAGTIVYQKDINPALFNYTRAQGISQFFLRVSLKKVCFIFETLQPATSPGALVSCVVQDPTATLTSSVNYLIPQLATQESFVQIPVWQCGVVECNILKQDPKYTHVQKTDPRVADFGKFVVATANTFVAAMAPCNIYIAYEMELEEPLLSLNPIGTGFGSLEWNNMESTSVSLPFGTGQAIKRTGNLGLAWDFADNVLEIPPGTYVFWCGQRTSWTTDVPTWNLSLGFLITELTSSPYPSPSGFTAGNTTSGVSEWVFHRTCITVAQGPASGRRVGFALTNATAIPTSLISSERPFIQLFPIPLLEATVDSTLDLQGLSNMVKQLQAEVKSSSAPVPDIKSKQDFPELKPSTLQNCDPKVTHPDVNAQSYWGQFRSGNPLR